MFKNQSLECLKKVEEICVLGEDVFKVPYLDSFRVTTKSQESLVVNLNYKKKCEQTEQFTVYGPQMSSFKNLC